MFRHAMFGMAVMSLMSVSGGVALAHGPHAVWSGPLHHRHHYHGGFAQPHVHVARPTIYYSQPQVIYPQSAYIQHYGCAPSIRYVDGYGGYGYGGGYNGYGYGGSVSHVLPGQGLQLIR